MTQNRKGGRGGGRVAVDGATGVERVTITLTPEDRAELRRLGGSPWIRQMIRHRDDAERWRWLRGHATKIAQGKDRIVIDAHAQSAVISDDVLDRTVDQLRGA